MAHTRLILFFWIFSILFSFEGVLADARVDGFFKEDMVTQGMFDDHRHIREIQPESSRRDSFFITREERRRNPERAPSNSIQMERSPAIRVSQYPVLRYPVLPSGLWLPGVHYSPQRLKEDRIKNSQTSQQTPPAPSSPPIAPPVLESGDSFDVSEKYELEGFDFEPEL